LLEVYFLLFKPSMESTMIFCDFYEFEAAVFRQTSD